MTYKIFHQKALISFNWGVREDAKACNPLLRNLDLSTCYLRLRVK